MEVLKYELEEHQCELEEAMRMEINFDEVRETKDGKKLYRYLRKRRRIVKFLVAVLDKM